MKNFFKNRLAVFGLTILILIAFAAVLAPVMSPFDPGDLGSTALQAPSAVHLFGTDDFGRDIFSRALYGARVSLAVGFIAVSIAVVLGLLFGAVAGFFGGFVDSVIMRFIDIMLSFPSIFLLLSIQVMLKPSIYNVMIVIGLTSWMGVARLVRAEILSVKERPYIDAAKAIGASNLRIIFRHVLPNAMHPVIVAGTLGIAGAILTESALSFLGLGVQPPYSSWGNMLQDSQAYLRDAWWMAFIPGCLILLTVLCIYLVGEGLREAMDPRSC
ncbi:MAG: ABC transporter permease [Candidatus Saganbacteria bacterium]|nr:ABC transporter permease [Candidatus Saganbacteria bacterium]